MTTLNLPAATEPTFYFIGVTTGQSSILRIFPRWMEVMGIQAQIRGIDLPLHAPPEHYRAVVEHVKTDSLVRGGLVTTHKLDLLAAARDLFDVLDANARFSAEVSCLAKRDGRLHGYAKDLISSGKAWEEFVPAGHFAATGAEALFFGSGGATVATTVYLTQAADRPRRVTLVDVSAERLAHAREVLLATGTELPFAFVLNADPYENDVRMGALPPGSVVVNGTGMGKDIPGSPLTAAGLFPEGGLVWDFNYRGELNFLHQARRQHMNRNLVIEDGWRYFVHGWTQVVAEVFQFDLTPTVFAQLDAAAR
jgi:shikimate 5-dehydrogenase